METGRDTDRVSLRIGPGLLGELERIRTFMRQHSGDGHVVRNRARGNTQTLYCSCRLQAAAALEDEEIDYN